MRLGGGNKQAKHLYLRWLSYLRLCQSLLQSGGQSQVCEAVRRRRLLCLALRLQSGFDEHSGGGERPKRAHAEEPSWLCVPYSRRPSAHARPDQHVPKPCIRRHAASPLSAHWVVSLLVASVRPSSPAGQRVIYITCFQQRV